MAKAFKNLREPAPQPIYTRLDNRGRKYPVYFGDMHGNEADYNSFNAAFGMKDAPKVEDSIYSAGRVKFVPNQK